MVQLVISKAQVLLKSGWSWALGCGTVERVCCRIWVVQIASAVNLFVIAPPSSGNPGSSASNLDVPKLWLLHGFYGSLSDLPASGFRSWNIPSFSSLIFVATFCCLIVEVKQAALLIFKAFEPDMARMARTMCRFGIIAVNHWDWDTYDRLSSNAHLGKTPPLQILCVKTPHASWELISRWYCLYSVTFWLTEQTPLWNQTKTHVSW